MAIAREKVAVALTFTGTARRLGMVSAFGTVLLCVVYSTLLVAGLLTLDSPQQPIGDPLFSILEILIILIMPLMVGLMVAVHAWAPAEVKVLSLMAIVFMSLMGGITFSVHFLILTLGRQAAFYGLPWMPLFLSFKWPSVPYASTFSPGMCSSRFRSFSPHRFSVGIVSQGRFECYWL
jgi:hypothetical protein